MLRIGDVFTSFGVADRDVAVAEAQGGLDRIGQAGEEGIFFFLVFMFAQYDPVHHRFDGVVLVAVQL